MKFNSEKLQALFNASGEKKKDFGRAIFGGTCRLGPEYFKDKDSISFVHLERLCERYHKPATYFIDGLDKYLNSQDTSNTVGNVVSRSNLEVETMNIGQDGESLETLKMTVDCLNKLLEEKTTVIKDKDETIKWMKSQWDNVLKTLNAVSK